MYALTVKCRLSFILSVVLLTTKYPKKISLNAILYETVPYKQAQFNIYAVGAYGKLEVLRICFQIFLIR